MGMSNRSCAAAGIAGKRSNSGQKAVLAGIPRFALPPELNKIFILFNYVYGFKTSPLCYKIQRTGSSYPYISSIRTKINQEWMIAMSLIPCTSKCVYQSDGICTLDSAAAAGLPSLGGACIHFIPVDAARLGSPHRYCEPGSAAAPGAHGDFPPDGPAPDRSGTPDDAPR